MSLETYPDDAPKPPSSEAYTPEAEDVLESFEVADGGAGDLDAPGRFGGSTRTEALAALQADAEWQPRASTAEDLAAIVERLPDLPGVYIMRDRKGDVVYVGKAKRLRARVRQYFNGTDPRLFVPYLAQTLGDIETVVTSNDKEALLLENNLIKKYKPRFNVKLRDDKQFLVLRLDPKAKWPRLELVRRMRQDGARYFGPYHSAQSARHTLRVVNRYFKLRTCTDYTLTHRKRPCLQHQIGRCPAPCVYPVDADAYALQVKGVGLFLEGRHKELVAGLTAQMEDAAGALEFETAARLRDQLAAISTSLERQQVVGSASLDQDVIGMYREGGQVEFVVMHVRQGKLLGTRTFSARGMELPDPDVLGSFLVAYYDDAPTIPDEILLPSELLDDDEAPLKAWLREHSGRKVALLVPERGDRKKLLLLAQRNAASNFTSRRNRAEDSEQALRTLQQRLGLTRLPRVIECYDISHIQGQDTVASMVVFVDGAPAKKRYRSFKIKGLGGLAQGDRQNDDFRSMYEVLGRRLKRANVGEDMSEEVDESAEAEAEPTIEAADEIEENTWALPDLMVIDGGKGQLGRVIAALHDLGVPVGEGGVDVVSLAKERRQGLGRGKAALQRLRTFKTYADAAAALDAAGSLTAEDAPTPVEPDPDAPQRPGQSYQDYVVRTPDDDPEEWEVKPERVFVPGAKDAIRLRPGSSELYLMTQIRDEAHRFAITHHRKRRGKRALHSALDDIPGVGPALKKALIQHFGTVAEIRNAAPARLTEVKGVGAALAQRIHEALREGGTDASAPPRGES
ncbi:Excinuclease ABC subunit C [Nannocystis exedens]|uniref:UvrABC system protein C n=1 Tax=Nannocystis exedens TaxID=54 RepID=A0A1I1X1N3_9BACT|nr:excinuclease ABC subunit UvrC [Nannocystis exedens]PCC70862.1 excinuclease ABC subunit C [Nannocystis exedens]SFE01239.1 Excinuclease ABC subunit C [Nannocystis exedens]